MHNNRTRWLDEEHPENNVGFKWIWTSEEIEKIPAREKGEIPLWKIFVATFVSTHTGTDRLPPRSLYRRKVAINLLDADSFLVIWAWGSVVWVKVGNNEGKPSPL